MNETKRNMPISHTKEHSTLQEPRNPDRPLSHNSLRSKWRCTRNNGKRKALVVVDWRKSHWCAFMYYSVSFLLVVFRCLGRVTMDVFWPSRHSLRLINRTNLNLYVYKMQNYPNGTSMFIKDSNVIMQNRSLFVAIELNLACFCYSKL